MFSIIDCFLKQPKGGVTPSVRKTASAKYQLGPLTRVLKGAGGLKVNCSVVVVRR
jgi:hypothetical protein